VSTGYNRVEGKSAGGTKRPRERSPTRNPYVITIRNFFIVVRRPQVHGNQAGEGQCATECMGVHHIDANTRCYPNWRSSAEFAFQSNGPTFVVTHHQRGALFVGPVSLIFPIFVDTTNASYNATFGRGYAAHDCPAGACYDAETGMRYWGNLHMAVLETVLWKAGTQTGLVYSLSAPDRNLLLAESVLPVAADAYSVEMLIWDRVVQFRTSPPHGWMEHTVEPQDVASLLVPTPEWQAPLMALGVVCAVALGAAMLAMRVQKTLHQTLLQVSSRAVGKLCVVPAGLSATAGFVSDESYIQGPEIAKAPFTAIPGRQHNCFPISPGEQQRVLLDKEMGTVLHLRTINQTTEPRSQFKCKVKVERQLVRLPWAADSCPWVGKLRTVLPKKNRVIRDSAVQ
jgi:hypothetical protein